MAGVVTPSMWMFEVRDAEHGGTAYCSLNEGLGKVLRYGAYGPEVLERLRWMGEVLGPVLPAALDQPGPIDLHVADRAGPADGRRAAQPQPRGHLAAGA